MTDSILRSYTHQTTTTHVPFAEVGTGLLDVYPTTLAGFSYRKLRSSYAGSAVRIRRSSDNAEQDIGFVGNDFDTSSASSFIGGGSGFIAKWYDQSGNGYDASQTTAGNQPTYTASAINGFPGHTYVNATPIYLNTTIQGIALTSTVFSSISIASRTTNPADAQRLAVLLTGAADGNNRDYNQANNCLAATQVYGTQNFCTTRAGDFGAQAISLSTAYRFMCVYDGSTANTYLSGTAGSSSASTGTFGSDAGFGSGTGIAMIVGAGFITGSYTGGWNGPCSETIFWFADQTSNAAAINTDLSTYYGV